jgi:hypothetical protein
MESVQPQGSDLERWNVRGLVPGTLTSARHEGVLVTFQELIVRGCMSQVDGETYWEAWWYCPRTSTSGHLVSAEPITGGMFGTAVKREVMRLQSVSASPSRPPPTVQTPSPSPPPPVEQWTSVTTTPEDHAARKARVRRDVMCRYCGNVTGTIRRVCQRQACQHKASKGPY